MTRHEHSVGLSRGWLRGLPRFGGAMVGCVLATGALAEKIEIRSASFGYCDTVQTDRHTFVRLYISSGDKPWSGVISLTTPHDNTQNATVTVRAATTPGLTVPVELPMMLTPNWDRIEIRASDGEESQRWTLRSNDFSSNGPLHPPSINQYQCVILTLGEISISRTFPSRTSAGGESASDPLDFLGVEPMNGDGQFAQPLVTGQEAAKPTPPTEPDARRKWVDARAHELWMKTVLEQATGGLPVHWQAYDSYELVIAKEADLRKQTRQASAALMEWVLAGGRLLVLLEDAGEAWRSLVPDDLAIETFIAGQPESRAPGEALTLTASRTLDSVVIGEKSTLRTRPVRALKLTPAGVREGWKVAWPLENGGADEGCLAYGPLGFGVIGFLGVEPDGLTMLDQEGTLAAARLWRDAVKRVAWAGEDRQGASVLANAWWSPSSGPTVSSREALRRTLDDITVVTPLGTGVFTALFGVMLALVLMLGPGDAIILKKLRLRHRSWMTALCWVGLACAGSALIPMVVRTGRSGYSVMTVEDVRVTGEGRAIAARTGIVGIFAGAPLRFAAPEHAEGSAWRGVSPTMGMSTSRTFEPLTMISREVATLGCRGCEIGEIGVGQWSFRTLQYNSACAAEEGGLSARVRADSFGTQVTLLNVPEDAKIEGATLWMRGKYYELGFGATGGGTVRADSVVEVKAEAAFLDQTPPTRRDQVGWPAVQSGGSPSGLLTHPVGVGFSLRGPDTREDGVAALVGSGAHAAVFVRLKGGVIPGVAGGSVETMHVRMARIVAPIEGDEP